MRRGSGSKTNGSNNEDSGGNYDGGYYDYSGEDSGGGYYGNSGEDSGNGYYDDADGTSANGYYGNSGEGYGSNDYYDGSGENQGNGYYGSARQNYGGGFEGTEVNDGGGYGESGQSYGGAAPYYDGSYTRADQYYGDGYDRRESGYGADGTPSNGTYYGGYYNGAPGGAGGYYNGAPGGAGGYYNGAPGDAGDYYNGVSGGNGEYYNGVPVGGNGGNNNVPPVGRRAGGEPPRKKKKSRVGDVISIVVMVVAFCVFVFAGYKLYGYYEEYKKVDDEYTNLATYTTDETESEDLDALEADAENEDMQSLNGREVKTVEIGDEEVTLPVMTNPIDFESLKEINSDIVGWLKIRALDLSYPVVQGEDNDYYLHRSFEQEDLFAGCLFVNFENESDFTDQNTIIYGHNMKNGSMFGTLKNLRDEETYNTSKYFWIFTEDIIYLYRIISARVVDKVGQTYQIVFTEEEFEEFLNTAMENSEVDNSDVSVSTDDKIVTLSTCTGDSSTRFVVQGKLVQMYASK